MSYRLCKTAGLLVLLLLVSVPGGFAATQFVYASRVDGFVPQVVNIFTGDTVEWVAVHGTVAMTISGAGIGSSTTTTNGTNVVTGGNTIGGFGNPQTFSFQFTTAGSFPYTNSQAPALQGSSGVVNVVDSPPTVTISSPTNGAVFAPNVGIPVTALVTNAVLNTQFFVNGNRIGFQTGTNATVTFHETALGPYVLTIVVTNGSGVVSTSAPVTVNIAEPIIVASPANNSYFLTTNSITIVAGTNALSSPPRSIRFLVNGIVMTNLVAGPYTYTLNGTNTGTYTLTVDATNSLGLAISSPPVTIQVGEPVGILTPTNNSVFLTNVSFTLTPDLSQVSLLPQTVSFIIGTNVFSNLTAAPFTMNVSAATVGSGTIQAVIMNSVGIASTSAPVTFVALGSPPPSGMISPTNGSVYPPGSQIPLVPDLSGVSVPPTNVSFYIGTNVFLNRTAAPFSVNFSTNAPGNYSVYAVLTYSGVNVSTSAPVSFVIATTGYSPTIQQNSLSAANGMFGFTFRSAANGTYSIQTSTDLSSANNWVTVTNITATGADVTFSTPQASSNAFFRWLYQ